MIKTTQPALHGDQHLQHGSDPIPGLFGQSPFGGNYSELVPLIPDLIGYWRLGESSAPWADTSGMSPAADLTLEGTGTSPTLDVPGGITVGDDGAIEFNYDGAATAGGKNLLNNDSAVGSRFNGLVDMTAAAWVKPKAASAAFRYGLIMGTIAQVAGSPDWFSGWYLQVIQPTNYFRFSRGQPSGGGTEYEITTAGGHTADQWYFLVGTYDGATLSLYINGVLYGTTADPRGNPAGNSHDSFRLGGIDRGNVPLYGTSGTYFYGMVDEAAVWNRALTPTEIASLYASSAGASPAGGVVVISDGAGGATWGQVSSYAIADDAVTSAKIAANAVGASELASTAVTPGTYGDATHVGQVTVDADGRVTSAAAVAITPTGGAPTGAAGGALDGTYPNPGLAASVAGAGLSETSDVLAVNVDAATIEINADTLRVKADGITANEIAANAVGASELAATAVGAGSYGDATHVGQFTVDADGRLTAAASVAITGSGGGAVATDTIWDTKGDLAAATGADAAVKVPVGSNNQVLVADSTQTAGIKWAAVPGGGYVAIDTLWDAKGDLAVGTAADTAARLAVGSNDQVLTADSTQTTGIKWATPATGAVATDALWDTKGDIAVASGADAADNLPVGSNNQVLTADSAQTLGVKWATPASAGAWTLLHTIALGAAGTFDQTSISGAYNDLLCVLIGRGADAGSTDTPNWKFNNDGGSNYSNERSTVQGNATGLNSASTAGSTFNNMGPFPAGGATANLFGYTELTIFGYAATTWIKAFQWRTYGASVLNTTAQTYHHGGGTWNSTAAINRITVANNTTANFVTNSQLRIYGRL